MPAPRVLLEAPDSAEPDDVYAAFTAWVATLGLELYPAQDEAVLELVSGANVVLSTPTGSGKSLVAVAAHLVALAAGVRSVYTAPIKALVSEKFFALCEVFGSANVGMMTGDAAVNADAPILCCTAEVLANIALRTGVGSDLRVVIMDEFHFYADPDRGGRGRCRCSSCRQAQFLLMSATLGDTTALADGPHAAHRPADGRGRPAVSDRCRCTTTTSSRRCTRRSPTCCRAGRRRSTSCTSPRPPRSNTPRR